MFGSYLLVKKFVNMEKLSLTIGWLYPELMSTYGDRGNIQVLSKKCVWSNIKVKILPIDHNTSINELKNIDLLFGGGSQDIQQEIVMRDLRGKGLVIKELIERNIPALFVCGSPQIMGKYYEPAEGKKIEGLGVFDMTTLNPGLTKPRCIGNIIAEVELDGTDGTDSPKTIIIGFENHGGRTYLGKTAKPFAKVTHGFGNNGEDGTEGIIYKNAIGCYFHGPLLPKNPEIANYLLKKALSVKYNREIGLRYNSDDILSIKAKQIISSRYID